MNRGTRSQKKFGLNLKPTAGWVALLAATSYGCGAKDDGGGSGDGDGDGDLNGAGGSGASSGGGEGSGGAQGTGGATTGGGNGSCAFETCDGSCVDTQTDDLNCGDCGELCD